MSRAVEGSGSGAFGPAVAAGRQRSIAAPRASLPPDTPNLGDPTSRREGAAPTVTGRRSGRTTRRERKRAYPWRQSISRAVEGSGSGAF
ncbi:MAG: hypothetical protein WEC74_07370, partial [Gammaproteobacteria bacterium]